VSVFANIIAILVVILGVPTRFKYVWQGTKIARRKSARDISRKFYIVSWVVYVVQLTHNVIRNDWVDAFFWFAGVFTVAYAIAMCYIMWHEKMTFGRWLVDSFISKEEGGFWR